MHANTYVAPATADDRPIACCNCGRSGVKLWRKYQTSDTSLLCLDHFDAKDQSDVRAGLRGKAHSIGWWVAAVPAIGKEGFWGFTSVPENGVAWWDSLPF